MSRPQIHSITSQMETESWNILDITGNRTTGILSSAVLGCAVILVDFPLGVKTKILLWACLALWSVFKSGSQLLTAIVLSFGGFAFTSNLFHCLAVWHLLQFLTPMVHHIQGTTMYNRRSMPSIYFRGRMAPCFLLGPDPDSPFATTCMVESWRNRRGIDLCVWLVAILFKGLEGNILRESLPQVIWIVLLVRSQYSQFLLLHVWRPVRHIQ